MVRCHREFKITIQNLGYLPLDFYYEIITNNDMILLKVTLGEVLNFLIKYILLEKVKIVF